MYNIYTRTRAHTHTTFTSINKINRKQGRREREGEKTARTELQLFLSTAHIPLTSSAAAVVSPPQVHTPLVSLSLQSHLLCQPLQAGDRPPHGTDTPQVEPGTYIDNTSPSCWHPEPAVQLSDRHSCSWPLFVSESTLFPAPSDHCSTWHAVQSLWEESLGYTVGRIPGY